MFTTWWATSDQAAMFAGGATRRLFKSRPHLENVTGNADNAQWKMENCTPLLFNASYFAQKLFDWLSLPSGWDRMTWTFPWWSDSPTSRQPLVGTRSTPRTATHTRAPSHSQTFCDSINMKALRSPRSKVWVIQGTRPCKVPGAPEMGA
jgi:hypothetical protein